MQLKIGDLAPNFKLISSKTEEISLESYKGKNVVLLFFPLAFTSVCTEELCNMRDDIAKYQQLDAEIIAISVDSPFVLAKFKEEQSLNFTLLSDFNKETSRAYGSIYEDFVMGLKGVSKRSAFVINKDGLLKHIEVLESAGDMPNFKAIKETLQNLN